MGSFWNSPSGMKKLAVGLVALALAGIAAVHWASQRMIAIQGPGTLQAINGQTLWLGVNDDLWVLDRAGHKTGQRSFSQLGLTEAVSNIALAPGGQALVTSRGDKTWQVLDTRDLSRVRTIAPQWPAQFRDNYLRAIHVAVSPDWDIAVATGGGHTVLLFDRDGKFKTQTAPDTFYFTNGLWHGPQGWWTTDTNRSTLRLLDTATLEPKASIRLTGDLAGYAALGELVGSHGDPLPGTLEPPVATVSRLGFLMEPGHAVDVFADGRHANFNAEPLALLRDMAWFNKNLLIVDGGTYQVLRFGADRTALGRFGDGEVNLTLQQMRADREFWATLSSRYGFLLAAVLLVAGIGAYGRHKKLAVRAVTSARPSSLVGTPRQGPWALVRHRLWIFGLPVVLRLVAAAGGLMLILPWLMGSLVKAPQKYFLIFPQMAVLSVAVPVLLVALWQQWRYARLSARPNYEATLNHKALAWLDRHDDWDKVRQPGEAPRETLYLPGWKPRWLLVTNQRILLFAAGARERRLQQEWPRRSVVNAGHPRDEPDGQRPWLWRRVLLPQPNLTLKFDTGERLTGRCASSVTAGRAAALLMQARPAPAQAASGRAARSGRRQARRRWHEVLASFVVPGLGQWLQDRFVTGTVLFTAGVLLCLLGWGPVLWAADGPKMHVDMLSKAFAILMWLALSVAAAMDAFHFSATRKPATGSRAL